MKLTSKAEKDKSTSCAANYLMMTSYGGTLYGVSMVLREATTGDSARALRKTGAPV